MRQALTAMGIRPDRIEILQHKDGVLTARVWTGKKTCIIKYYENSEYLREIENYRILFQVNVPTLRVLASTDRALVLEDLSASERWRLGREADLQDPKTAAAIARWYRRLHEAGAGVVTREMYDESDLFSRENIRLLPGKTGTEGCEV